LSEILSDILNYFLPIQSLAQASVHLAITAVTEIVVKGCSRILGSWTTGKSDSFVAMAAGHRILPKSVRLCELDRNAWRAGFWSHIGHP